MGCLGAQAAHVLQRAQLLASQTEQAAMKELVGIVKMAQSREELLAGFRSILPCVVELCNSALADGPSEGGEDLSWGEGCLAEAQMLHACLMTMACMFQSAGERKHGLLKLLSDVALEMDGLSIPLFGALCREECGDQLRAELEGSMVCLLMCMLRAGPGTISSETIFELVHGDALWAFLLANAVAKCTDDVKDEFYKCMSQDWQILAKHVLEAVLGLHQPHLPFLRENTFHSNSVPIDVRRAIVLQHRAEVASAFMHSRFEATMLSKCDELLPELASLLACIASPNSVILESREQVWDLLFRSLHGGSRMHWANCAVISIANPPELAQCGRFLFESSPWSREDELPYCLSAMCVLSANAGLLPCQPAGAVLQEMMKSLSASGRAIFLSSMERWRGIGCRGLDFWRSDLSLQAPEGSDSLVMEPGLRHLSAPRHLCCSLDGHLLLDPIRTPHGHLFERSNLSRALQDCGRCPVTASALNLADCQRSPRVRAQVLRWIRNQNQISPSSA